MSGFVRLGLAACVKRRAFVGVAGFESAKNVRFCQVARRALLKIAGFCRGEAGSGLPLFQDGRSPVKLRDPAWADGNGIADAPVAGTAGASAG